MNVAMASAAAVLLHVQVYSTVTFQVPAPDCYTSWQQQQQSLPQQEYQAAVPQQLEYQQQYPQQQQQYQPPMQAYSPPGYAAYPDPDPAAAVPGAVCYVGPPQQQQQQYKVAGGGGAGGGYDASAMPTAPAWPGQSY
jgi:hypothetical protein